MNRNLLKFPFLFILAMLAPGCAPHDDALREAESIFQERKANATSAIIVYNYGEPDESLVEVSEPSKVFKLSYGIELIADEKPVLFTDAIVVKFYTTSGETFEFLYSEHLSRIRFLNVWGRDFSVNEEYQEILDAFHP